MNSLGALQVDGPEPKLPHQDLNQDSKGEKEEHFVDAYAVGPSSPRPLRSELKTS